LCVEKEKKGSGPKYALKKVSGKQEQAFALWLSEA
jgi:hypothetical protein